MGKLNGTLMVTLVNGVKIGGTKSCELDLNRKNIETSSKDSGGNTNREYGQADWGMTFSGLYDPALLWNVEEMFTVLNAKTKVILEFAAVDGVGGGLVYRGTGLGKDLKIVAGMEESVTISGSFEADGALTQGTIATS
jgi:hypothetical protein